jgi:ribosome-associated translation inhibitor RaiA
MKTSIVYKIVEAHQPVETEVQKQLTKIEKLLKSYKEDMPQLHVACEKNGRGAEYSIALNLWLPTGTLHAVGTATTVRAGCKKAFGELERQIKKHQALLRKDYEWKRKRGRLRELEAS